MKLEIYVLLRRSVKSFLLACLLAVMRKFPPPQFLLDFALKNIIWQLSEKQLLCLVREVPIPYIDVHRRCPPPSSTSSCATALAAFLAPEGRCRGSPPSGLLPPGQKRDPDSRSKRTSVSRPSRKIRRLPKAGRETSYMYSTVQYYISWQLVRESDILDPSSPSPFSSSARV